MRYEIFADFQNISFMKIGTKGTVLILGLNETRIVKERFE